MDRDAPLPIQSVPRGTVIARAERWPTTTVTPDSPALEVMTDLTRVKAAIAGPATSLRQVEQIMINQGVRMLFIVSDMPTIDGLITTTDLHGGAKIRAAQRNKVRYDELSAADLMTPLRDLDAIDFEQVQTACVGNLVATLKRLGRNHLLVVDRPDGQAQRVRGVISKTQIERQLGSSLGVFERENGFAQFVQVAP